MVRIPRKEVRGKLKLEYEELVYETPYPSVRQINEILRVRVFKMLHGVRLARVGLLGLHLLRELQTSPLKLPRI
jgi:hypothetical protein